MKVSAYTKRRNQKIIKIYIEMLTTECYTTYSYRCLYGVNCTLFEISAGVFGRFGCVSVLYRDDLLVIYTSF